MDNLWTMEERIIHQKTKIKRINREMLQLEQRKAEAIALLKQLYRLEKELEANK